MDALHGAIEQDIAINLHVFLRFFENISNGRGAALDKAQRAPGGAEANVEHGRRFFAGQIAEEFAHSRRRQPLSRTMMRTKGECVAVVSKRKCSLLRLAALQCEVNKSRHGTAPP